MGEEAGSGILEAMAEEADALNRLEVGKSICISRERFELRQFPSGMIVNEDMWDELFSYEPPLDVTKTGPAEYEIKSVDRKVRMVFSLDSEWKLRGKPFRDNYIRAEVRELLKAETPDSIEPALDAEMPADIRFYKGV